MASSSPNTLAHFLHDAGLAAWFGGSLAGAIGFNGAAADVDDPTQRARVANAAWARWTPANAVGIGAHLFGAVQIIRANKSRVATQKGVGANSAVKAVLTAAALGATGYSRVLGNKIQSYGDVPVAGGTDPLPTTPDEVASAQKQLKALQWTIPGITGLLIASSAKHEEQQRPAEVAKNTITGLPSRAASAVKAAGTGAAAKAA